MARPSKKRRSCGYEFAGALIFRLTSRPRLQSELRVVIEATGDQHSRANLRCALPWCTATPRATRQNGVGVMFAWKTKTTSVRAIDGLFLWYPSSPPESRALSRLRHHAKLR